MPHEREALADLLDDAQDSGGMEFVRSRNGNRGTAKNLGSGMCLLAVALCV